MSNDEATWSVKEVFTELKRDIMTRFDNQDMALIDIRHDLSNTATKEDVREVHLRVDAVDGRVQKLEDHRTETDAIRVSKRRIWAAAVAGATCLAALGAVLANVIH